MSSDKVVPSGLRSTHSIVTLAAIGAIACIAADMVHEGLGHGIVSWLTGDRILSISTVALQNAHPNRVVSAAGTCANVIAGILSLLLLRRLESLRRLERLTSLAYFLWVFAGFNLFNVGYLAASAVIGGGDWGNVISGLTPVWLWRSLLGLAGVFLYIGSFRWLANFMIRFVNRGAVALSDQTSLVWPPYLAGGVVLTLAAIMNPISPSLILISGVGASFGLNFGFLLLPGFVAGKTDSRSDPANKIPFSVSWLIAAIAISGVFIGIIGPGIQFAD